MSKKNKNSGVVAAIVAATTGNAATVSVAKALLAVAGMAPASITWTSDDGSVFVLPLATANGSNKRALACACYHVLDDVAPSLRARAAAQLLLLCGVGYCHSTNKALVGEVRGERGLAGYVKPNATWFTALYNNGSVHPKVQKEVPTAAHVLDLVRRGSKPRDASFEYGLACDVLYKLLATSATMV